MNGDKAIRPGRAWLDTDGKRIQAHGRFDAGWPCAVTAITTLRSIVQDT